MSKSSGRFGGRKSTGAVTVIEARVHRTSARNAKLAFFLTLFTVGLLTATIAADHMHPILAMILGAVIGTATGAVAWALVRIWPVIRLIWWWTPELVLVASAVSGFTALARHTVLPVRLVVLVLMVGVPAALPWTRRRIVAVAWCLIVRHRIRTCFDEFIITNQSGSLPLILWARPTPAGERVWVWLRPGLSLGDLAGRLDKIAVACWASSVVIERASDSNAALLRVDVKRRDVLTGTVVSPLVAMVDPDTPKTTRAAGKVPTELNLVDVTDEMVTTPATPSAPAPRAAANGKPAPAAASAGDDLDDWI